MSGSFAKWRGKDCGASRSGWFRLLGVMEILGASRRSKVTVVGANAARAMAGSRSWFDPAKQETLQVAERPHRSVTRAEPA